MATRSKASLATYQAKRDFAATSEPSGAKAKRTPRTKAPRFVVQQHDATAMHWDFRLEHDGVLVSWAVPKGPPERPKVSRLAIRTEDHPLDYIDFAGDIPEGSYGAGHVEVWDHGTYTLEELDLDAGKVHVELHGERLNGRYMLVRTKEGEDDGRRAQWLLRRLSPAEHPERAPLPQHAKPMLCTPSKLPPHLDRWAAEVKWDGVRALAYVEGGRVRLESRNGNDLTDQFPEIARMGRAMGSTEAVLDGELVAFDAAGRPSFQQLQSRLGVTSASTVRTRMKSVPVTYVAFDVLQLDGRDLHDEPYEARRNLLRAALEDGDNWQVPASHDGAGAELLESVVALGMEGVVLKRLGSPYREGVRSGDWLKVKAQRRQEFVICGWVEGSGGRGGGIGSLLLGYHDGEGRLVPAGGVGTGFTDDMLKRLHAKLAPLERKTSPYDVAPRAGARSRRPGRAAAAEHFVTPKLVCEVEFTEFTRDGTVRHPSYKGLRDDKRAADVVREEPVGGR
ncbi:MAG: ligD [Thermoleophilia bacterium]|nr:ligD [Thermoleophilia bacterium]